MTNLRACCVQWRSLTTDERGRSSGQDCVVTGQGEVEGHRPCHRPGHTRLGQWGRNEKNQYKIKSSLFKGFAKLKKLKKSKKNLDGAHNPSTKLFFFGNPSLTWSEHSNHNNEQLLTKYIKQNTHGILLQYISTGLEQFWDDFPHKKIRVRP